MKYHDMLDAKYQVGITAVEQAWWDLMYKLDVDFSQFQTLVVHAFVYINSPDIQCLTWDVNSALLLKTQGGMLPYSPTHCLAVMKLPCDLYALSMMLRRMQWRNQNTPGMWKHRLGSMVRRCSMHYQHRRSKEVGDQWESLCR